MQFGVCGGSELAPVAAEAGFDYLEGSVAGCLKPREPDAVFEAELSALRALALPMKAVNSFLPGDLKISGPEAVPEAARAYACTALRRAAQAGIETIVFGSGGARRCPEGWDPGRAFEQVAAFLRGIAPVAESCGVTLVVEPLRSKECNLVTTVARGAELARAAGSSHVRLLVDGFHWAMEQDSGADIAANGALLRHAHLATLPNRLAPGGEDYDFGPFFRALRRAGYDGRVSIEGRFEPTTAVLARALALLRQAQAASAA